MSKTKKQTRNRWILIAIVAACLAAPNGTFIKLALEELDIFSFSSLRFGLIALVTLPYLFMVYQKFTKKNFKYSLYAGIAMTIAVICYSTTVKLSQASYASITQLGIPIVFIIYSIILTKERVKPRSLLGISIASIGAFLVIGMPIIISGSNINPVAIVTGVIDCLVYPLCVIFFRKANESGLPIMASFCVSSVMVALICTSLALGINGSEAYSSGLSVNVITALVYSGIIVALIVRVVNVLSYEHIGSAALSGTSYLESLMAIIIPLIVLRERLSAELVIGAILIIIGVYIVETVHNSHRHRNIHVMRHR